MIAHPVTATRTICRGGIIPEKAASTKMALSMNCPTTVKSTKRRNMKRPWVRILNLASTYELPNSPTKYAVNDARNDPWDSPQDGIVGGLMRPKRVGRQRAADLDHNYEQEQGAETCPDDLS